MKNVIRSLSGLAAFGVGVCWSAHVSAGFFMSFDNDNVREVGLGAYEIDLVLGVSPGGLPPTLQMLAFNLTIAPANGYSLDTIAGARFDGFRNLTTNPLFPNATPPSPTILPLQMTGALINFDPVPTPANSRLAFTVLFGTGRGTAADIEIRFSNVTSAFENAYMVNFDNEGDLVPITDLRASFPITVVRVPEPSVTLMALLATSGAVFARRRRQCFVWKWSKA